MQAELSKSTGASMTLDQLKSAQVSTSHHSSFNQSMNE
jgi:hypothetical protein